MTVTPAQKTLIEDIVNVFETGSPQGDYGEVCTYCDGKNGSRQITYGRSQTTEQGNLQDLIIAYCKNGGRLKSQFAHFIPEIGDVPLWDDEDFVLLLREAASDPVMRSTEDEFFDSDYFTPALKWATAYGFTLPLSQLAIYDSFIQSGRVLDFLRGRFQELPPLQGGDEKVWIKEYTFVRSEWLRTYNDPSAPAKSALLRKTVYRTGDIMRAVVGGNWDLAQSPFMANGTPIPQPVEAA
jgi:chitosanase